jgi:hypothetical protein
VTAIAIPGNPLRSFDISWVSIDRGEYYLADRSNAGIDVIDTKTLTFKRTIGGFVGILPKVGPVNNNISGPDGVTSYHRWLYAGDGDSTLKVIDLEDTSATPIKQTVPTGGTTRVDEMALTNNGKLLLAANNAEILRSLPSSTRTATVLPAMSPLSPRSRSIPRSCRQAGR